MPRMTKDVSLRLKRRAEKATMRLMSTSICPHDGGAALIARGVHISDISDGILYILYMTQCRILGKFEYTRGPIFKVVLEC